MSKRGVDKDNNQVDNSSARRQNNSSNQSHDNDDGQSRGNDDGQSRGNDDGQSRGNGDGQSRDNSAGRAREAARTGKNAVMLLAGTMTRMIASFVFVLYCSAMLGVIGFGQFSIATHYFELFLSLCSTSVGILLTRDIARQRRHLNDLLGSALLLVVVMSALAVPSMYGISRLLAYSPQTHLAMLVASSALLPASIAVLFEAVFVALERAEFVTLGTLIESMVRVGVSIAVLSCGGGLIELMWTMLGTRLALCIVYAVCMLSVVPLRPAINWKRTARFVHRWRVFAAENWLASIYTNLDVIILSWLAGERAVGLYSAAWKIVRLGAVVAKSYTTAVYPVMSRMYRRSREDFLKLYHHTIHVMCVLALPAIALVTVIPDRIIALLFDPEYADAANVLRVLIWVLLIEFLNPFLSHALFAQGRQQRSMIVAGISFVVNLIATFWLVRSHGAVGAALGTVLGGFVATCCYLAFALPWREIIVTCAGVARVLAAAIGLGLILAHVPPWPLPWILTLGACVYTALLFLCGALRPSHLQYFRTTFLSRAIS